MASLTDLVWIDATGYHYLDYPAFLEWQQNEYRTIYGADTYLEPDSQDGQLIAIRAQALYDTAALGASVYNSFSPSSAQGVGLSRVVKINGIARLSPTFSTVDLVIGGQVGTVITNGVVEDELDQKWSLPSSVTIPSAGVVTITASAQEIGSIRAEPNTVNRIFTPTLGWQTANNPNAAAVGEPVETDAELRQRQAISTANPSLTVLEGTVGAVSNLTGVTKVRAYENDTDATDANGIPEHSIALVVYGGDATEIAQTIALHKTPGCGTYGNVTILVYDAHGMPLNISFSRPIEVHVGVKVTITVNTETWSDDFIPLIQASIATTINEIGIGNDVLLTRLYSPAYLNGTLPGQSYDVISLEINKNGGAFAAANIDVLWDELALCDPLTSVEVIKTP